MRPLPTGRLGRGPWGPGPFPGPVRTRVRRLPGREDLQLPGPGDVRLRPPRHLPGAPRSDSPCGPVPQPPTCPPTHPPASAPGAPSSTGRPTPFTERPDPSTGFRSASASRTRRHRPPATRGNGIAPHPPLATRCRSAATSCARRPPRAQLRDREPAPVHPLPFGRVRPALRHRRGVRETSGGEAGAGGILVREGQLRPTGDNKAAGRQGLLNGVGRRLRHLTARGRPADGGLPRREAAPVRGRSPP